MTNTTPFQSSRAFWIGVVVLAAAHIIIDVSSGSFEVTADGREYLVMAQNLRASGEFTYDGVHPVVGKPPGTPVLIATYLSLVGSLNGFRWLQVALLYVSYLCVSLAVRRHWSNLGALATLALLVALWPMHRYAHNLLSEPLFLALTGFGMFCLVKSFDTPSVAATSAAGVLFGLSVYVRPITLVWPLLLLAVVLIVHRSKVKTVLLVLLVHLVVISPWMLRNWHTFDRFVPMVANWGPLYYMTAEDSWQTYFFEGSGIIRASTEYQEITQGEYPFNWEPSQHFRRLATERIIADPGAYIGRCVRQALFVWTYVPGTKGAHGGVWFNFGRLLMLLFFVMVVVGSVRQYRHRQRGYVLLVLTYALSTGIVLFPVCSESRYLVPVYIWLVPIAIAGSLTTIKRIIATRSALTNPTSRHPLV